MKPLPPALAAVKKLLQGRGIAAHPLHVAINHVPLGLWEGGAIFDLLARRRRSKTWSEAGYYLNLFAIAGAVPTALTGLAEFWDIPTDHPAWKTTLAHAGLNNIALTIAIYNWYSRRNRRHFMPDRTNLWMDGALMAVLGLSGYLGGVIAHEYGYGTHRQGASVEMKQQSLVGPSDRFYDPKVLMSPAPSDASAADSSLDSWAGTAAGDLQARDETVEESLADPGEAAERGGSGI
jgi:uncharacterized membrane protein